MEHTAKCNIPRSPGKLLVRPVVVLLSLSHSGTSWTRRGVVIVAISKQTDQQQFSFSSFVFFTFNWLSVPRHQLRSNKIFLTTAHHITSEALDTLFKWMWVFRFFFYYFISLCVDEVWSNLWNTAEHSWQTDVWLSKGNKMSPSLHSSHTNPLAWHRCKTGVQTSKYNLLVPISGVFWRRHS